MGEQKEEYTSGETARQIDALWDSHRRLEQKLEANTKEIMVVSTQVPYIVSLLERIDKAQCVQSPICAVRGAKIADLEKRVEEHGSHERRLESLEASNRILKWMVGSATAIGTTVAAAKLIQVLVN